MVTPRETDVPVWLPNAQVQSNANVAGLMAKHGVSSYDELHAWSVAYPDDFWASVIEDLGITDATLSEGVRGSADPREPDWLPGARLNIAASCLAGNPESAAIVFDRDGSIETMTVGDLTSRVAEFAAGFAAAGYLPGDALAIIMPMTVEAVVAYLGTIIAGGVVVSIADSFAADEISSRLTIADAVAVVTQGVATRLGKTLPMYEKCVEALAPSCIVVGDATLRDGDIAWSDFIVPNAVFDPVVRSPSDVTNILFSSGTTGDPKAIPWTHTTPIKAAMDGRFHQDIHDGDVVVWPTNLGWMMGPWLIYASLLNGAAMALYGDAPTTPGFVKFVEDASVTMVGVVPSIVAAWRAGGLLAPGDWSAVRVVSSTGEASNASDYAWLTNAAGGVPIIEYCGGTEIGGGYVTSTVLHPSFPSRFTTAALGVDVHLVGDDGIEGNVGEVFLSVPSIGFSTTLLNRDHTEVYYDDVPDIGVPIRRHGDQMERNENGLYRALGRVDDTMNLGGIKVSSAELEDAMGSVAGVSEVAAVAVSAVGGGPEKLVVFVVTERPEIGHELLQTELQAAIRSHINPLFHIADVVAVDALPRTASHKIMRRVLRSEYVS